MIPSGIPAAFRTEDRDGERLIWNALQRQLDDGYTVLWSVTTMGHAMPREIDFLVVHPSYGLLAIEVKGGIVTLGNPHDRATKWTATTRTRRRDCTIDNPFDQAQGASMAFVKDWKERSTFTDFYAVTPLVALPHTPRPPNAAEALKEFADRALFENELKTVGDRVRHLMAAAMAHKPGIVPLGDAAVASLIDLYGDQHAPAQPNHPAGPHEAAVKASTSKRLMVWGFAAAIIVGTAVNAWVAKDWWMPAAASLFSSQINDLTPPTPPTTPPHPRPKPAKAPAEPIAIPAPEATPAQRDAPECKPFVRPIGPGQAETGTVCRDRSGRWVIVTP